MPSTVSVVIVNFQAYEDLARSLAALRTDEDGPDVCVVDQAGNPVKLANLRAEYPRVTFIASPENRGFAWAVNLAASQNSHEWLLILNPDCVASPAAVARLAEWLEAHPKVGAVGPRVRDRSGDIQASARRFPGITTAFAGRSSWLTRAFPGNPLSRLNLPVPADMTEATQVDWVSGACVMVRRRAFDSVGGMDPRFFLYWEDADLGRRLKNAGWSTYYLPDVEVTHAVGRSSRHVPVRSAFAFHVSALRYYWKHASSMGRLFVPIVAVGLAVRLVLLLSWNYSRQFSRFVLDLIFGRAIPDAR